MSEDCFDEIVFIQDYGGGPSLELSPKPEIDEMDKFLEAHNFTKIRIGLNDDYDWYQLFSWTRNTKEFGKEYIIEIITPNPTTILSIYCKEMASYIKCLKDVSDIYYNLVFTKSERDRVDEELQKNSEY